MSTNCAHPARTGFHANSKSPSILRTFRQVQRTVLHKTCSSEPVAKFRSSTLSADSEHYFRVCYVGRKLFHTMEQFTRKPISIASLMCIWPCGLRAVKNSKEARRDVDLSPQSVTGMPAAGQSLATSRPLRWPMKRRTTQNSIRLKFSSISFFFAKCPIRCRRRKKCFAILLTLEWKLIKRKLFL